MKYIITGKNDIKGILENDITKSNPIDGVNEYFELGWELVGSRIEIIRLLQENKITVDDCIVTIEDRKFLYTKIFKNVISYAEFKNLNIPEINVLDYTNTKDLSKFSFLNTREFVSKNAPYLEAKYKRFYQDYNLLTNLDFSDISHLPINSKYYCVCLRYRGYSRHRNSTDFFWDSFLQKMDNLNKTVFIVGKGAEKKCNGKNIIYIDKLSDYCSLIKNENCVSTLGCITGTITLAFFCCTNKLFMIDHSGCVSKTYTNRENHAALCGKCIRFMNIPYEFILNNTTVDTLITKIL